MAISMHRKCFRLEEDKEETRTLRIVMVTRKPVRLEGVQNGGCCRLHHLRSRSPIRSDLDSGSYLSKYATMHNQHIVKKSNDLKPSPKCAQRPQTHGGQLRSPEMIVLGCC